MLRNGVDIVRDGRQEGSGQRRHGRRMRRRLVWQRMEDVTKEVRWKGVNVVDDIEKQLQPTPLMRAHIGNTVK